MTINLKNFLSDKTKLSKMGEFQNLKQIEGLEMSSVSADLYGNGRDDLSLFYFSKGANYATVTTTNSIISETIAWNNSSHKKLIKGIMVNTKNANTFTGKQGKESLDIIAKNLAVMDATAVVMCQENKMPLKVFNILKNGNLKNVILDDNIAGYYNLVGTNLDQQANLIQTQNMEFFR